MKTIVYSVASFCVLCFEAPLGDRIDNSWVESETCRDARHGRAGSRIMSSRCLPAARWCHRRNEICNSDRRTTTNGGLREMIISTRHRRTWPHDTSQHRIGQRAVVVL